MLINNKHFAFVKTHYYRESCGSAGITEAVRFAHLFIKAFSTIFIRKALDGFRIEKLNKKISIKVLIEPI